MARPHLHTYKNTVALELFVLVQAPCQPGSACTCLQYPTIEDEWQY